MGRKWGNQKKDNNMQLLSVVVPVYNTEKYLGECIESILNQTYQNLELILVNDGSTDNSGMICDGYKKADNRVSVIHTSNQGPLSARLAGIKQARGNCITFVDSDDWICLDTYEKVMSLGEADVISFGIIRYFSEKKSYKDYKLEEKKYNKDMIENLIIPQMLWNKKISTCGIDSSLCTKVFRKELIQKYIEKAETLDIYYGQDVAVLYPLLLEADSLINSIQCYYFHRQRPQGVIWPYFDDEAYFDKVYKLYSYLKNEFQENKYWSILQNQLDKYYRYSVVKKKNIYDNTDMSKDEEVFPYWKFNVSSRVILYGAGVLGKKYKEINDKYHFCNIVLWVDRASKLADGNTIPQTVDCIQHMDYDAVLIAVKNSFVAAEIKDELMQIGVPEDKIVWRSVVVSELMYG